jgi:hypothetical protein
MKLILILLLINLALGFLILGPREVIKYLNSLRRRSLIETGEILYMEVGSFVPGQVQFGTETNDFMQREYKFFGEIFKELYEINRKYGAAIKGPWKNLRRSLQKDLSFEKKVKSISSQAMAQMFVMSLFLLLFATAFSIVLSTAMTLKTWGILFILIGLAWAVYLYALKRIKLKQWRNVSLILRALIMIDSLAQTGLSNAEILRKSGGNEFSSIEDEDFNLIKQQFNNAIDSWQRKGNSIKNPIEELSIEFWFVMEQKLEKMTKRVQALQLVCTFIFILPAFFFLVSSGFSGFLIE